MNRFAFAVLVASAVHVSAVARQAPPNDDCVNAITIGVGTTAGTNVGATTGSENIYVSDTGVGVYDAVWYRVIPPCSGYLTVTVSGAFEGSAAAVSSNCGPNQGAWVGNQFWPPWSTSATFYVEVTAGQPQILAVGSAVSPAFGGTQGPFTLDVTCHPAPSNDKQSGAIPMTPGLITGSTWWAANDQSVFDPVNDVWYVFTPPSDGTVHAQFGGPGTFWTGQNPLMEFGYYQGQWVSGGIFGDWTPIQVSAGQPVYFALSSGDAPFGWGYGFGDFAFQLDFYPPPANDECAGAITIGSGVTHASNFGASLSGGAGCAVIGDDVWFRWTATCDGQMRASSSFSNPWIAAYDASCSGTLLGCAAQILAPVHAGQVVLFAVGSLNGEEGPFQFEVECFPPPPNDDCLSAIPIGTGITGGTTAWAATGPLATTCFAQGSDVWYRYTASETGLLVASLCSAAGGSSSQDAVLAVFSGSCGSLTQLGCSDNACGSAPQVVLPVTAGQSVLIEVATKAAQGSFQLAMNVLSNDDPTNPKIVSDGLVTGSTIGATSGNPVGSCPTFNEVWFEYRPTCTGVVTIGMCASGTFAAFDSVLNVFTDAFGSIVPLVCSDNACGTHPRVSFPALAGQRILVSLGSKAAGSTGTYAFAFGCTPREIVATELLATVPSAGNTALARLDTFPPRRIDVGATGIASMNGVAIQPGSGAMYAVASSAGTSTLYTLAPASAQATLVGTNAVPRILGLTFDSTGALFGSAGTTATSPATQLVRLDVLTGASTTLGSFLIPGTVSVQGLAPHPTLPRLVGVTTVGSGDAGALYSIDPLTGLAVLMFVPTHVATGDALTSGATGVDRDSSGRLIATLTGGEASGKVIAIDVASQKYEEIGRFGTQAFSSVAAPCPTNELYGAGCASTGGEIPLLTLTGCSKAGGATTLRIDQGTANAPALLVFGTSAAATSLPGGCTLAVGGIFNVFAGPVLTGSGDFAHTSVMPSGVGPATLFFQAVVADPQAAAGFVTTNGVELTID